jgi:hypothetical protein
MPCSSCGGKEFVRIFHIIWGVGRNGSWSVKCSGELQRSDRSISPYLYTFFKDEIVNEHPDNGANVRIFQRGTHVDVCILLGNALLSASISMNEMVNRESHGLHKDIGLPPCSASRGGSDLAYPRYSHELRPKRSSGPSIPARPQLATGFWLRSLRQVQGRRRAISSARNNQSDLPSS